MRRWYDSWLIEPNTVLLFYPREKFVIWLHSDSPDRSAWRGHRTSLVREWFSNCSHPPWLRQAEPIVQTYKYTEVSQDNFRTPWHKLILLFWRRHYITWCYRPPSLSDVCKRFGTGRVVRAFVRQTPGSNFGEFILQPWKLNLLMPSMVVSALTLWEENMAGWRQYNVAKWGVISGILLMILLWLKQSGSKDSPWQEQTHYMYTHLMIPCSPVTGTNL